MNHLFSRSAIKLKPFSVPIFQLKYEVFKQNGFVQAKIQTKITKFSAALLFFHYNNVLIIFVAKSKIFNYMLARILVMLTVACQQKYLF